MAWDKYFTEGLQSGVELALKRKALQAEEKKVAQQYQQWQQENQVKLAGMGYMPQTPQLMNERAMAQSMGMQQSPTMQLGNQNYQFNPQVAQQQILAQIAPYMAMSGQGNLVLSGISGGKPVFTNPSANPAQQKLDLEKAEKEQLTKAKSQFVKESAFDTLKTIEEVEKGISNFGLTGGLPSIPGTERMNWEVNVNKLLSGKVINLMTTMKEASKTGATGFGQLSEKELAVLKEASTALKRGLSSKDAQRYLNDMKTTLNKIAQGGEIQITPELNAAIQSTGIKGTIKAIRIKGKK